MIYERNFYNQNPYRSHGNVKTAAYPDWLFDSRTFEQIRTICAHRLRLNLKLARLCITNNSIFRCLQRVYDERQEPRNLMINRVVMIICNEMRTFELEKEKALNLENVFTTQALLYDNNARKGPDLQIIKLSKQPTSLNFYYSTKT